MIRISMVAALCGLVLATGCGKKAASSGKPKVAVSIFPIYDLTRRVAGDRIDVILVLPPGKSEHGYDPTPKEIARLDGAKLGIAVGLDMDGWVETIMKTAGDARILRIGERVKTIPIDVEPIGEDEAHEHEGDHHDDDDHAADHAAEHAGDAGSASGSGSATGSGNAAGSGSSIASGSATGPALRYPRPRDEGRRPAPGTAAGSTAGSGSATAPGSGSASPEAHGDHEDHDAHGDHDDDHDGHHHEVGAPDPHVWLDPARMAGVVDQLAAELTTIDPAGKDVFAANAAKLKAELVAVDAAISTRSKAWTKHTIVTFHGSMAYFAKRYHVRIAAVVEPIAGKEPTAAYIAEVLEAIKRSQAAALFTEPQLDRAPGEMIAKEAGIPLGELDPVGGVSGRDTYEALLLWNADQLEKVLK